MDYTPELAVRVRQKLGESYPDGGSAADTMFADSEIQAWIEEAATLNHAVVEGWEAKLAHFSNLVDVTDGAASRKLGDLAEQAEARLKYYRGRIAAGPDEGLARTRARIGKIVRNG
jgi:hypothetical protein